MSTTIGSWSCPVPLRDHPNIVLGHGGGGQLSAELIDNLFLPAFGNGQLAELADAAVVEVGSGVGSGSVTVSTVAMTPSSPASAALTAVAGTWMPWSRTASTAFGATIEATRVATWMMPATRMSAERDG